MTNMNKDGIDALAEAWASIDGKLDQFRSGAGGYRDGYLSEAEEMLRRLETRGFRLIHFRTVARAPFVIEDA